MQLFVLALVIGILAHDTLGTAPAASARLPWPEALAWIALPKLLLAGVFALLCRRTTSMLGKRAGRKSLDRLYRYTNVYRYLVLALFANDLRVGFLLDVRAMLGGNWILIDELIVMTPTLAMMFFAWWAYYPVDRALREASLIGRIDAGLPIHPIWTRGQYLVSQWRHQIALMFVPLMLMLAWIELVTAITSRYAETGLIHNPAMMQTIMVLAGTGCVFLFAPVMIRWMWDTVPLPSSDLRERLSDMCRMHRVGVRELLLWRTFGGMINAAVMGLVAPLRYILLSDGLLEMMPGKQVEAVMAHEIAHVRKGHMFWLLAAAVGLLLLLSEVWEQAMLVIVAHYKLAEAASWDFPLGIYLADPRYQQMTAAVGAVGCWCFAFGWVSRRFERQADTFAVQHLALTRADEREDANDPDAAITPSAAGGGGIAVAWAPAASATFIDTESVHVMTEALRHVAELNHVDARKRSWRHGSILWRQNYLRSLVGLPADRLAIDRQVFWIKVASAAMLATVAALLLR